MEIEFGGPISSPLSSNRYLFHCWYGHVMKRNENHSKKKVLRMQVDGCRYSPSFLRSKKSWTESVKADMRKQGVTDEMTGLD